MSEEHIYLDDLAVGVLSDKDIKYELKEGDLVVDPISDEWLQIQPATIDLRLGNEFIILERENITHIDPLNEKDVEEYSKTIKVDDEFTLHPGRFVLGTTVERVEMPNYMIAEVEGRSSLGRLAIIVHATAGLVDPGYNGTITLELSNLGSAPVLLRPGMRICQLKMLYLNSIPDRPYGKERGSKYQNQDRPTPSKIGKDPEFQKINNE